MDLQLSGKVAVATAADRGAGQAAIVDGSEQAT